MRNFVQTAEAIRATSKKLEKTAILAQYFRSQPVEDAVLGALYFSGRAFPASSELTLQVGGALLWKLGAEITGIWDGELSKAYRRFGDLGDALEAVLIQGTATSANPGISLAELAASFGQLASARGVAAKAEILRGLLDRATPGETKYVVKIILGDLRIGSRESLVEEATAKAFERPLREVQRANMMLGDIGETLRLAAANKLQEAKMRLFHPLGFMLASPVADATEALRGLEDPAQQVAIEDKYDGIRAQAHIGEREGQRAVRIFSRTLDEISHSFPELIPALSSLPGDAVLDGEIVAWQQPPGRALPFSVLQQRLGRKKVTEELQRSVPVAYVAFDVLYANGELIIDRSLRERSAVLDPIFAGARGARIAPVLDVQGSLVFEAEVESKTGGNRAELIRAPVSHVTAAEELDTSFDLAQERGNEGLMIKNLESAYTPGRRGGAWLKLKRELAMLDVVVTAAEYGHGKRASVLSDYTFAVRDDADPNRLLNVGKAYSGLTDREIRELTELFLQHTTLDEGFRRQVQPLVVLEVAFNNVMISDRHESGFALRFPRIVRVRTDKPVSEIDTVSAVRAIYQRQHRGASGSENATARRRQG